MMLVYTPLLVLKELVQVCLLGPVRYFQWSANLNDVTGVALTITVAVTSWSGSLEPWTVNLIILYSLFSFCYICSNIIRCLQSPTLDLYFRMYGFVCRRYLWIMAVICPFLMAFSLAFQGNLICTKP